MNARRAVWAVPLAVAGLLLAGCGSTAPSAKQGGANREVVYNTGACSGPSYIRERAPEGVCASRAPQQAPAVDTEVDDSMNLGRLFREQYVAE
ncbi:hypothetical protein [Agromyces larvae]|uniref:DUF3761 domain-containing protein n=1 Tax=Agromyces larvae TaxID=2929802 RepID=A0ABY4BVR5_9MICO|nr:hypothetical protein [Agromyces larvae]UOE43317.1 hypothetical protein MTO99_14145 [Agromyces larvae]